MDAHLRAALAAIDPHAAAADALSLARRADAARECLAGLVGYVPKEVGR